MTVSQPIRFLTTLSALLVASLTASAAPQKAKAPTGKLARYVRIELSGPARTLSLAEVQVVRDGRNIAPNGVATQSTNANGGMPGRAIDGSTSGIFTEGSVTHTESSQDPWWELDLGKMQGVQQVTIWNRTDCCEERLDKFTLKLLDHRRKVTWERKGLRGPRPRTDYMMTGEAVARDLDGEKAVHEDVAISLERRQRLQPAINTAINRGTRYLKDTQLRDGSWGEHVPAYRAGQTALSLYTLVKCGVPKTDPVVQMGLRYLQSNPPIKTYSLGITMMLYETMSDENLLDDLQDFLDRMVETQIHQRGADDHGLWGYPGNRCDMSNTQYAGLGLLAAKRAGLKVPAEVFRLLLAGTIVHQEEGKVVDVERESGRTSTGEVRMAGFCYRTGKNGPGKATGSMTTAGLSLVAICEQGLEGKLAGKAMRDARVSKRMGMEWLDRNFSVKNNPGMGAGRHLYYLYGLERVGALLGVDYIGGQHWYWEGSEVLVKAQGARGEWANQADTCFALLFLSKATASGAQTGPVLQARDDVRVSNDARADIHWRATGTNPVTMWITGFGDYAKDDYSEKSGIVKGMRITGVDYLCDGEVVQGVKADSKRGWNGERFAARHKFAGPGFYKMEVRVRLIDPLALAGEDAIAELVSEPLEVFVRDAFDVAAIEASSKMRRSGNLLNERKVTRVASSFLHEPGKPNDRKYAVEKALDGLQITSWLCAKGNELPTLVFTFDKPLRANTLVLSDANQTILTSEHYDQPTRIEVIVNNQRNPQVVEISNRVLSSWKLKFKSTTRVRTLEIRIVDREPGKVQPGIVGFAEVELLYER